ncbi:hypothetical protein GCM10027048_20020 [Hymenobacter coalescens]
MPLHQYRLVEGLGKRLVACYVPADFIRHNAYSFYSRTKLRLAAVEFTAPVAALVRFVHIDPGSIGRAAIG